MHTCGDRLGCKRLALAAAAVKEDAVLYACVLDSDAVVPLSGFTALASEDATCRHALWSSMSQL